MQIMFDAQLFPNSNHIHGFIHPAIAGSSSPSAPWPGGPLAGVLALCLARAWHWDKPPNWSAGGWREEITEVVLAAAAVAELGFDPTAGISIRGLDLQPGREQGAHALPQRKRRLLRRTPARAEPRR